MKIKSKQAPLKPESFPELKLLSAQVGEFIEYWGFKEVHGRLWCYLFLAEGPLSTQQIMQLLGVSKALVSQSIAELLDYQVIEEAGRGKNGVNFYRANPNVGEVIAGVLRSREKKMLHLIQATHESMKSVPEFKRNQLVPMDSQRFELLGEWVQLARALLDAGISMAGTPQDPFAHPDALLAVTSPRQRPLKK